MGTLTVVFVRSWHTNRDGGCPQWYIIADMPDELVETAEQKLARYETVIGLQMEEIDRLRAVVAKLTEGADDAHSTLRRIYLDEAQPSGTRVKAATASINFEKSRFESVPPPLDLVREPDYLPLAEVVRLQRARIAKMEAEGQKNIKVLVDGRVLVLDDEGSSGNGSDDSDHS